MGRLGEEMGKMTGVVELRDGEAEWGVLEGRGGYQVGSG